MASIVLVTVISYFALSSIFLIALLRSAARTSLDWTASTLLTNQTLTETNLTTDRGCDYQVAADAPSLMVAVRRQS